MEVLIESPRCEANLAGIRKLFDAGKVLTVQSVRHVLKTQELRHYVSILRKEMEIESVWFTATDGRRFKKYWKKKNRLYY